MSRRYAVVVGIVTALAFTIVLTGCDQALSVAMNGTSVFTKTSAEKHRFFEDFTALGPEKSLLPQPGATPDPVRY